MRYIIVEAKSNGIVVARNDAFPIPESIEEAIETMEEPSILKHLEKSMKLEELAKLRGPAMKARMQELAKQNKQFNKLVAKLKKLSREKAEGILTDIGYDEDDIEAILAITHPA